MSTFIPSFFVIQIAAARPYLSSKTSGNLQWEVDIWGPGVKFAAEPSSKSSGMELVHIRSCYNNKYWVVDDNNLVIRAIADKPVEDTNDPGCTLFSVSSATPGGFAFGLLNYEKMYLNYDDNWGLALSSFAQHYQVVDWETLVILPTQVSFKSEELDGNYLCSRVIDRNYNYHRFESGLDVGDPLVAHELFPTPDGNYRIKNLHFGKFWRRSPNWIWADAEQNNNSRDTLFSFVKISDGVFALRNLGNNYFCGGLTTEGKTDCLNAQYPSISRQARLIVEERVLQRKITNIQYRLSNSRIYDEQIQEVSHAFATNNSADQETSITLNHSSTDSKTSTWTNSVSVTIGVTLKFKASAPFIAEGGIETSTEVGYAHEWGVAETTEITREVSYLVVVPPLTKMKVSLMSTRGACDVPFSYTQHDLRTNGEWVTTLKDDGVFTGINSYNFYFESSEVVEDDKGRIHV